jgi:hypothetical protein
MIAKSGGIIRLRPYDFSTIFINMLFASIAYIGVDPAPGKRTIHYAALGPDLELLARGQGDLNALLTFLSGHQQAVAAIHGPMQPNHQILTDADRREQYLIPMSKGRPGNMRVAEYTLRQHGLPVFQTPAKSADAPQWMQTSFQLYAKLKKAGFQPGQPEQTASLQFLEVLPELGYRAWLESDILPPNTLLGRLQRQLALYELGLQIPDPMTFFEEVTRFRILQGALPQDQIYTPPQLSALAAAYLAWQSQRQPESLAYVGIAKEGLVAVPAMLIAE